MQRLTMKVYQRNVTHRLIALRLFLCLAIVMVFYFILSNNQNPAYLVSFFLLFFSFIRVTNLTVFEDNLSITRWYLFGIYPMKLKVTKSSKHEVHLYSRYETTNLDPLGTWLDFLYFIPLRAKIQGLRIHDAKRPSPFATILLPLNDHEYFLIHRVLKN